MALFLLCWEDTLLNKASSLAAAYGRGRDFRARRLGAWGLDQDRKKCKANKITGALG